MLDFKVQENHRRIKLLESFKNDALAFITKQGIKIEALEDQVAQNKIVLQYLVDHHPNQCERVQWPDDHDG